MSNLLTITKTYANGSLLAETNLDHFKTDVQTFVNTTMLTADNVLADSVAEGMTSTGANSIAASSSSTGANAFLQSIDTTAGNRLTIQNDGSASFIAAQVGPGSTINSETGTDQGDYVDTFINVTATARNRPIMIFLQAATTSSSLTGGTIVCTGGGGQTGNLSILLKKDGLAFQKVGLSSEGTGAQGFPPGCIRFMDLSPGEGSIVYSLAIRASVGTSTISFTRLMTVEL